MKKTLLISVLCLMLVVFSLLYKSSARADIALAQNGRTPYVIALANDAIPAEKTATDELKTYLQQVTGATFSIESETAVNANTPQILVGAGARTKVLLPDQDWASLGTDGIVIKTVGKNLILAGGRPRGSLYAVYQFLEDTVGCRWWTSTEDMIPQKSTLIVPGQNVVYRPPFDYREHYTTEVQADPIFATIMRENGHFQKQTPEWGGHYTILGFVHTFSKLLPPEKYFQDHPEWYSDPGNGNKPCTAASKRPAGEDTQLNLSKPGVLDELTKQALAWIKANPEAGYISISQNDNRNYCRDAASMKLAEEEGSQAAPVLNFINKVAVRIHQQYPDFKVETLAYSYSENPPKTIRLVENVIIRLAPISSDFGHPLDSDWNAETRDNLKGWAKIAPELFVWNYVTNYFYTLLPHPNWASLGADLRFFANNHVKGIYEEDRSAKSVGDFIRLRTWLLAHLMWNPNLDQDKLTDEFLQGYYGPAAPYLKQYLDLVESSFLAQNKKLLAFNSDFSFLDLNTTNQAIMLFEKAQDAVKDQQVLLDRVTREKLSLDIAILVRYQALRLQAKTGSKAFLGPKDPKVALQHYIASAKKYGVEGYIYGNSFEKAIPGLEASFAPPVSLPDFAKKFPEDDVVDLQQSLFQLFGLGTDTFLVEDAAASDGNAASITGGTINWAIMAGLGNILENSPVKWHVYAMVRVDTNPDMPQAGLGLESGIYDYANNKAVGRVKIPLKQVAGSIYQPIDLGVHQLSGGMRIWFASTKNPVVTKVYVDRIILIKEK
jgi:hypothetical protein